MLQIISITKFEVGGEYSTKHSKVQYSLKIYKKNRLFDVITALWMFFNAALSRRQLLRNFHKIDTFCYLTLRLVWDCKLAISAHFFIQYGVCKNNGKPVKNKICENVKRKRRF